MRWFARLLLIAQLALPLLAAGQITVSALEQAVAAAHGKPDRKMAQRLSGLELNQRLSTARLERLKARIPSEDARMALLAVADSSAFLDLPAEDLPAMEPLDRAAQDALLAKTAEYAEKAISRMPDLFAVRQTISFANGPQKAPSSPGNAKEFFDPKLHLLDKSTATVRFLAGRDETVDERAENGRLETPGRRLATEGVFATVFAVLPMDVLASHPVWSHWEQGSGGPMAVFRYDVPEEKSHYSARVPGDPGFLKSITAYHGEMAVDPSDGSILRLTLLAVPRPGAPVSKADIVVEYGPVEIAGKRYICPLRSVAISLARVFNLWQDVYGLKPREEPPLQLQLNDVAYTQYHQFRSEMRMLP